ncbi:MAG: endonuclease/exonuclease/phosphatase family protein [Myxococcales bacterium]
MGTDTTRGWLRGLCALGLGLAACSSSHDNEAPTPVRGTFSVLTYNVAGLPEGISGSHPAVNTALMSPLLDDYEVVLVQEDFAYHQELVHSATQLYQSAPDKAQDSLGDGLNILSDFPFDGPVRAHWKDCNGQLDAGSDCLTPKGFFVVQMQVAEGAIIDVYNLHADAGRSPADAAARQGNFAQLQAAILANSQDHAVIVAGDFNERYSYVDQHVSGLLSGADLKDVWVELERGSVLPPSPSGEAPECANDEANLMCERIDKILYRSSASVTLTPTGYRVDSQRFTDADGRPLSDHPPVVATFDFVAQ